MSHTDRDERVSNDEFSGKAPERIWMHAHGESNCWCSYHFDVRDDPRFLTEYARVGALPEGFVCIAPDEAPLVLNFLCGTGSENDKELGRLHLNLCARCKETAEVVTNAATRMRDRCVEKVKHKADCYQRDSERSDYLPNYRRNMALAASALREVANGLQSLTLEQGEQEKSDGLHSQR